MPHSLLPALALLAAARIVAAQAQTTPTPDRLSDAEFRALMTTVSEPGGIFAMGNTFTSNEPGFPNVITSLGAADNRGGAYVGVGPEQNFTYIAALHPRIAFIIDIRRQAIMQHLMYKALFEMATDRADFLSLLFARPRPAGLDSATSVQALWTAYWNVRPDTARATRTMRRITDRLTRTRGIQLDSSDAALLRYVYASFVNFGPAIRDEPGPADASLGYRLASSWSMSTMSMTVEVRDSVNGAPLPSATVRFGARSGAFGGLVTTDSAGRFQLAPYLVGTSLRVDAWRAGYDTARVAELVIDRARSLLTIRLVRGPGCTLMAVGTGLQGMRPTTELCASQNLPGGGFRSAIPIPARPVSLPRVATNPSTTDVPRTELTSYFGGPNIASITSTPDRAGVAQSFLATESAFRVVKDMHERNLIVPVVGDFAGPTTIRTIGSYLRQHGTTVSAFYVSNVLGYLYGAGVAQAFFLNAATLPATPASLVIVNGSSLYPLTPWVEAGARGGTPSLRLSAVGLLRLNAVWKPPGWPTYCFPT